MRALIIVCGSVLIAIVLWDAFETVILPRRVTRRFRLTSLFYRGTWAPWSRLAGRLSGRRRESFLSFFGPLSLLLLLTVWAAGQIVGFAVVNWGLRTRLSSAEVDLGTYLYTSGVTFFTLGYGDVVPLESWGRALAVLEAGIGFGFLAVVISYLPVLYQAFSRREVSISLLDARAGSPPTAAELIRRHGYDAGMEALASLLRDWELWSAELMESHLSYPVLSYFRSQHDNQSWLAALTAILDTCALVMAGLEGACQRQAELTFAMARHTVVDIAQVLRVRVDPEARRHLPPMELYRVRVHLRRNGLRLREGEQVDQRLVELRQMYEPYIVPLAEYLCMTLPPWMPQRERRDNWQTTAWGKTLMEARAKVVDGRSS